MCIYDIDLGSPMLVALTFNLLIDSKNYTLHEFATTAAKKLKNRMNVHNSHQPFNAKFIWSKKFTQIDFFRVGKGLEQKQFFLKS